MPEYDQKGKMGFVGRLRLMNNHVHLAIRTGTKPLSHAMRSLLTGYAGAFNRRYRRSGHLFQNRYKSTLVEDEPYFFALIRYIHRNPLRARIVGFVEELIRHSWTGHSVLMGKHERHWQDVDEVLSRFGAQVGPARRALQSFMGRFEAKNDERVFRGAGGGLLRSMGGLESLGDRRKGSKWAYDERVLGSSKFVEKVLKKAELEQSRRPSSAEQKWRAFDQLVDKVCQRSGITENELFGGTRRPDVVRVRQVVAWFALREVGLTAAGLSRVMNISDRGISKAASGGLEALGKLGWAMSWLRKKVR